MSESGPDEDVVELAHRVFDMAREGDSDRLLAYVEAGVPVELTDASGNTLLMISAYHGHADLVQRLADAGADVNRLNDRGQSPLGGRDLQGGGPRRLGPRRRRGGPGPGDAVGARGGRDVRPRVAAQLTALDEAQPARGVTR